MLLPTIEVRNSPIQGRGLFASAPIPKGTVVWHPCTSCRVVNGPATAELADSERAWLDEFGYRLVDQGIILPCPTAYLMNHSCEANVLDFGLDFGLAVRDIAADEEVLCDFRTFVDDPPWSMTCACGAPSCVGVVEPAQGRSPAVQQEWLRRTLDALRYAESTAQPLSDSLCASGSAFAAIERDWRPGSAALRSIRKPSFIFGPSAAWLGVSPEKESAW